MRSIYAIAALALALPMATASAQKSQDELRAQRAKKLAKPVFEQADWLMDYDEARRRAAAEGKWILCYFTRSYAP